MRTSDLKARLVGFFILVLCAACALHTPASHPSYAASPPKEVLVIHSYHPSLSWTHDVAKGMEEGLSKAKEQHHLSMEWMDTRRYRAPEYREKIANLLSYKLKGKPFDLIMVSDNDALEFVLTRRKDLFPRAPVVFCGINNFTGAMISGYARITGVSEDVSLRETLDTALKLHPDTRQIVVIGRTTVPADRADRDAFISLIRTYSSTVEFVFWDDLGAEELDDRLPSLKAGTLIFINGLTSDTTGRQLMYGETTQRIRAHSSVPLYSLWDVNLGYGILGGKLVSGFMQGKLAGELAARILDGEDPNKMPVIRADAANRFMFDYHELIRFAISEASLPEGSLIINRPNSFYMVNKAFIRAGAAALLLFSAIIIFLVIAIVGRKKAERSLSESESTLTTQFHFLQNLIDTIPSAVFYKDTHGVYQGCNKAFEEYSGLPKERIVGKTVFEVHPKEIADTYYRMDQELFAHPGQQVYEGSIQRTDGRKRNIMLCKATYTDPDGRLAGLLGVMVDITERKSAEEGLIRANKQLEDIIEFLPDATFIIDKEKRIIAWNRAMEEMTGASKRDMIGKDHLQSTVFFYGEPRPYLMDLVDKDDSELALRYDSVKRIGNVLYAEAFTPALYDNKGAFVFAAASPLRDREGNVIGAIESIRDITERKQAEEALRESEQNYRNIFENAVEGIFQSTPEGRYRSANPALARMYGFDSPEALITTVTDIARQIYVNPEDRLRLNKMLEGQAFVENYETEQYRKDGGKIWTSSTIRAVRSPEDQVLYYEGTVQDITERKSLEAQLLQAQKMEAIGTLAGGVAHDFNNILMALMGYANLLQMKMAEDDPLGAYVDQILASTAKAANLTHSLLAFGRKQMMELRPYSVNAILRDVEGLLRRLLPEDIQLTMVLGDDVTITADMTQIDQVLMNLATNARDAMPQGGELRIESTQIEIDEEFLRIHGYGKPGPYALLSVRDTGTGIDAKTQEKIFEPFYTTKEVGKGTGLGLSIIYGIVKQHEGYVTVSSEPNAGTTFRLYLPAAKEKSRARKNPPRDLEGGRETILFAEDNPDIRTIAHEILETAGYTVIEATDGEDAIEKFMEHKDAIDLLVLDVVMPRKNGKEAYEAIRAVKKEVKVLFVSGYAGDVVLDKGISDKDFHYVSKPLAPHALLQKIREALGRRQFG